MADAIRVEVVYALAGYQDVVKLTLPIGALVKTALEMSGLLRKHPEIDLASGRFGVFSRPVKLDAVLRDRDRLEIYRPLLADPKEVRRLKAAQGKSAKTLPAQRP